MTRMNPGTLIVSVILLVVAIMVLANSNITIPPESWLFASLIGAVFVYVVGERLIKKWGLTDFSAKGTRVAFAFGAVVVAGIRIYFTVMSYVSPGASLPTWLEDAIREIGWFGVISLAVIALTLVFGAWRYRLIPGNTSVYLLIAAIGFCIIVGGAYVIMMKLAPQETEMILGAAQNEIQGAAQGLVKTDPYGGKSIDWQAIAGVNWEKFFGILFFAVCVVGFVIYLIKGHKIATLLFVVTAAALVLPTAFYLSLTYAVPEPVKEFVTGAATTVYEANPLLGEPHFVNLAAAPGHRLVVANIGPYDTLTVYLPEGSSVDWHAFPGYESIPGYDHEGYYMYNTTGSSGFQRYYAFTEEFRDGLSATGKTVTMEIWAVKQ